MCHVVYPPESQRKTPAFKPRQFLCGFLSVKVHLRSHHVPVSYVSCFLLLKSGRHMRASWQRLATRNCAMRRPRACHFKRAFYTKGPLSYIFLVAAGDQATVIVRCL